MKKTLTTEQAIAVSKQLKDASKKIVLVGGCFDILHIGHLTFLQKAKKKGDVLLVLVESDESITNSKGQERPINTQENRAKILEALHVVDYVILLPPFMKNEDYDTLIGDIHPSIIATTKGDPNRSHKERQAAESGARVVDVTPPIKDHSTTRLIDLLKESYED